MKSNVMIKRFIILFIIIEGVSMAKSQNIPRPEYPRPQFERSTWQNLNGEWTYIFDFGNSGEQQGFSNNNGFEKKIIVPFCPESKLSGVEHKDFINHMWYQRKISIPESWNGKDILLHFGAVYYEAEIYIDGKLVGRHFGGTSSFEFDITSFVQNGAKHNLVVHVNDDLRSGMQPGGKQCFNYFSEGCSYTRTTGIWQTVWMEAVSSFGLQSVHLTPDIDQKQLIIQPHFITESSSHKLIVILRDKGKIVSQKIVPAFNSPFCILSVPQMKTWSPESPFLYDLTFKVLGIENQVVDSVKSYVGMRKVHIEGNRVFLNNKPYYQRLVLDQGFYPDGIWTAPTDKALKSDIALSLQAGFNGARLHQKVFEERFYYWADKLGYLTWAESSSWGLDVNNPDAARNFLTEWEERVKRDRNHPSIIVWTPFNETWDTDDIQYPRLVHDVYWLTKELDPTRPINDASGGTHVITDIWSVHNYEHNPDMLSKILTPDAKGEVWSNNSNNIFSIYSGQPYMIDEFGGIKWSSVHQNSNASWGYGETPQDLKEYYTELNQLVDTILSRKNVAGYCYTQLTDVEQEQNGIYFYDRTPKFDIKRIYDIFSKVPQNY
jgi:beta-galactosidase/beta-glucuronidase